MLYQTTMSYGHTARWTAPEILDGEGWVSKQTDIFSFSMVMIEVHQRVAVLCRPPTDIFRFDKAFTGTVPFHLHSSVTAMAGIIDGERPPRPAHPTFTSQLWELMQRCWDQDPHMRPKVSEVLEALAGLLVLHHFLLKYRSLSSYYLRPEIPLRLPTLCSDSTVSRDPRHSFLINSQAFFPGMNTKTMSRSFGGRVWYGLLTIWMVCVLMSPFLVLPS